MDKTLRDDLLPRRIYQKITDITPADLDAEGADALLLDIDNTLAFDGSFTLFPGVREWAREMRAAGVPMMILSNTYPLRAHSLARRLGLPYYALAEKPSPKGFLKCAEKLGVDPAALAMAGDQLFTDIRGANTAGCIPLLVRPQHTEVLFYFKYQKLRALERDFLRDNGFTDPAQEAQPTEGPTTEQKEGQADE